jgi:hypothetical protein
MPMLITFTFGGGSSASLAGGAEDTTGAAEGTDVADAIGAADGGGVGSTFGGAASVM